MFDLSHLPRTADVQVFMGIVASSASGWSKYVWTRPNGKNWLAGVMCGGGGRGGAGFSAAAGTSRGGGGGGGYGAAFNFVMPMTLVPKALFLQVGRGANDTVAGGTTLLNFSDNTTTSGSTLITAPMWSGGGVVGATATTGTGGAGGAEGSSSIIGTNRSQYLLGTGTPSLANGSTGGTAAAAGAAISVNPFSLTIGGTGGGGAGTAALQGDGGAYTLSVPPLFRGKAGGVGGVGSGGRGLDGDNRLLSLDRMWVCGGTGGGGSTSGVGGRGGDGGPGCGGGGGGGGTTGGAGGNGGPGFVILIAW